MRDTDMGWSQFMASLRAFLTALGTLVITPAFLILLVLVFVSVAPIFLITYAFLYEDLQATSLPFFTGLLKYSGTTTSHEDIWKLLAPLLIALSAGVSLKTGVSWKATLLILLFFMAFIAADYCRAFIATEESIITVLRDRDQIKIENLTNDVSAIGSNAITAIAILMGLAVAKMKDQ